MTREGLIKRLESAQSGTAELNAAVGREVGTWRHADPSTLDASGDGRLLLAPKYTTSLTDARALCSGQISLTYGHVGQGQYQAHARVTPGHDLSQWFDAWAATPELALTAAALKARAS